MESLLNAYARKFNEEVVFLSLEESMQQGSLQAMSIGTMVPVFTQDLVEMAKEEYQKFSTSQMIGPMIWMLGMDPDFRFNAEYRKFLRQDVKDLEKYGLWLFGEAYGQEKFRRAFLILRGLLQEGYRSFDLCYSYAHLCKEMLALEGEEAGKQGLYKESRLYFQKSLEQPGRKELSYYQLGYFSMQEGDFQEALDLFQKAKQGIDDEEILEDIQKVSGQLRGSIFLDQAEVLMEEQRFEEAVERLKLIQEPTTLQNWRKHYDLGYCFRISGNYEAALGYYETAYAINHQDSRLLNEMALAYTGLEELEQAGELLKMALLFAPDHIGLLCNLSMVQLKKSNKEEALATIKKAADLEDKDEIVIACYKAIQKSLEE